MKLAECFARTNVVADLVSTEKDEVIREMVKHLAANGSVPKSQSANVERAIIRREELGSTGIGKGVALPHAKVSGVTGVVGAFARSIKGVGFNALDGQPVHLVFMLVSSPDAVEPSVAALQKVAALLRDDEFCMFLRRAKSQSELADLLREADERLKS